MQVEPKFHEDASNLEELVPFEECIELHSTDKAVLRAPEYLLLTHNGRSFKLVGITSLYFHIINRRHVQVVTFDNDTLWILPIFFCQKNCLLGIGICDLYFDDFSPLSKLYNELKGTV